MPRIVGRMLATMALFWGLVLLFLVVATEFLGLAFWIAPALVLALIGVQWAVGPVILRWIYDIRWVDPDHWGPETARMIRDVCTRHDVPIPRFGVIDDGNPNAFAFGWTRRSGHVVVTEGVTRYCTDEETRAVIAHELGHVVHDDFVVMTLMSAVPTLFYVIGRTLLHAGRRAAIFGLVALFLYWVASLGVLLVNRYREHYADEFAADVVGPNALSSALVKVSYGLAQESEKSPEDEELVHARHENALMFQSARDGTALIARARAGEDRLDKLALKETMAWDLWNPWATWWEIHSTHPLTAHRIEHLGDLAQARGEQPYIAFDLAQPESYLDEFLADVAAKHGPWIAATAVVIGGIAAGLAGHVTLTQWGRFGLGGGLAVLGGGYLAYVLLYHMPKGFEDARVLDLLGDPAAGPVRGRPVRLEGEIVGRGRPGLWWSEDVKIDDGSALLLVDYHQVTGVVDFFVGLFETEDWVDETVEVEGWYRRYGVPWLELYRMEVAGESKTMYTRAVYAALSAAALSGGVAVMLWPYWAPALLG